MDARHDTPPEQRRRTRELELDAVVGHELAVGSPAARAIWRSLRQGLPSEIDEVRPQAPLPSGRPADFRVMTHDGRTLFVENKINGGQFEEGQVDGYVEAGQLGALTCLIAPDSFLTGHQRDAARFAAAVTTEEMADSLRAAAVSVSVSSELAAGYRYRADILERISRETGWVGDPDDAVAAFGEQYRDLLLDRGEGKLRVTSDKLLQNKRAGVVEFAPGFPVFRPLVLSHQLVGGYLDLRVPGWETADLAMHLRTLSAEDRPPDGWAVVKTTGRYPALRRSVGPVIPSEPFDEARPTVEDAIRASLDLSRWLDAGGALTLEARNQETLGRHLRAARDIAAHIGDGRVSRLLASLREDQ